MMNISTADALHSIVSDARRRQPERAIRTNCPACHMPRSVTHASLGGSSDYDGLEACHCEQCSSEWIDRSQPDK